MLANLRDFHLIFCAFCSIMDIGKNFAQKTKFALSDKQKNFALWQGLLKVR